MSKIKIYDFVVSGAMKSQYAADHEMLLKWMSTDLTKLIEYYRFVYMLEQRIRMAEVEFAMDIQAYQDEILELDRKRTAKHNDAIAALVDLDSCTRQAGFGSCVSVTDIEAQNRSDIGDAIFDFCGKWVKRNKQLP